MQEILRNVALRRTFFICVIAILGLLFLLRLFIIGDPGTSVLWNASAAVTQSVFAATFTTMLVGLFLFYVTPAHTIDPTQLQILQPRDMNAAFEHAISRALSWQFKGALGRYLRSKVIPELAKKARDRHMDIQISGIILDPTNEALCAKHADHRNGVMNVDGDYRWDAAEVQNQLYATILVAQIIQRNTALLDIRLYLENHFSPSRLDLSTELVLVTKEDRTAPAILAHKGNYFYESYGNEFAVARSQATEVTKTRVECDLHSLNAENAKKILEDIGLWRDNVSEDRLMQICNLVKANNNPYG